MCHETPHLWADPPTFYEFFAGGGMVRAGLGPAWRCLFANDIDPGKASSYAANWGGDVLHVGDVAAIGPAAIGGRADLIWGSFPCQDLSLAGAGAGLAGARSGAFHAWWRVIDGLIAQGRAPRIAAVENVTGALSANGGRDFDAILRAFAGRGYRPGAVVIDAALFTPQSRPRLFVVGLRAAPPPAVLAAQPDALFHPPPLRRAVDALPAALRAAHLWWRLPAPPVRDTRLADVLERDPADARWRAPHEVARLLALMTPAHRARVEAARRASARGPAQVGCLYRRTRRDAEGRRVQRAEARFDGVAGCLRTPAGGSSRQTLLIAKDGVLRARLVSARETARLMGLSDDYILPQRYSEAYHLTGDGVSVDAVRWLRDHLFHAVLAAAGREVDAGGCVGARRG